MAHVTKYEFMRAVRILGHPVAVISFFLLVLISGQHFGGFYLLYILMGLPFGASHAIIAMVSLSLMVFSYKVKSDRSPVLKSMLSFVGSMCMVLALYVFFQGSKGYNDSTFQQVVPLASFFFFAVGILCNTILATRYLIFRRTSQATS